MTRSKTWLFLIIPALFFLLLNYFLFLKDPPIWPDEPIYANIAENINQRNLLASNLWSNIMAREGEHFYWYPPIFLSLVAFWLKIFGASIENQRLLSILVSFLFLIVFYFLGKSISKKNNSLLIVLVLSGLIIDPYFSKASRISRPEIFVLLFSFLSLYFLTRSNRPILYSLLAGFSASLTFLTHLAGTFVLISIMLYFFSLEKLKIIKSKKLAVFLLSAIAPIGAWTWSIWPNISIFKEQIFLNLSRKTFDLVWFLPKLLENDPAFNILFGSYFLTTLLFFIHYLRSTGNNKKTLVFIFCLVFTWLISIKEGTFWYFALIIPFIYLALLCLMVSKEKNYRYFAFILFVFIFSLNLLSQANILYKNRGKNYSYQTLTARVLEIVPEGKTVFLSSIPDVYYGFISRGGNNQLLEFPVVKISNENHYKLLNKSDYIIFNGIWEGNVFGNLLENYINNNSEKTELIYGPNQYQVSVIKLKPKEQRF